MKELAFTLKQQEQEAWDVVRKLVLSRPKRVGTAVLQAAESRPGKLQAAVKAARAASESRLVENVHAALRALSAGSVTIGELILLKERLQGGIRKRMHAHLFKGVSTPTASASVKIARTARGRWYQRTLALSSSDAVKRLVSMLLNSKVVTAAAAVATALVVPRAVRRYPRVLTASQLEGEEASSVVSLAEGDCLVPNPLRLAACNEAQQWQLRLRTDARAAIEWDGTELYPARVPGAQSGIVLYADTACVRCLSLVKRKPHAHAHAPTLSPTHSPAHGEADFQPDRALRMRLCMLDSHHFTFNAEDLLAANHSHGLSPSSSYTSRHKSTAIAASANFFSAHLSSYFHHSPASAVAAAADPGGPAVRGGSIPDMVVNSPSLLPLAVLISFLFAALPLQVFCLCFFSRRAHSNAKQIVRGGDIDATSATGSTSVTSPTTVPIAAGAEHQVTQARRVMDPTGRWGARMKSPKKSKPEKKKRRGDARKREDGKLAAGEAQACTGLGQTCVRQ